MSDLYTIGHSTHSEATFLHLLARHGITAVGDVRSAPYSRFNPQYNRETLRGWLAEAGIAYVFLGAELGARVTDPTCRDEEGRVRYEAVARADFFLAGLERVRRGAANYTLALMCAEKDPLPCHRTILVCRALRSPELEIRHILGDGEIETHVELEIRLRESVGLAAGDLFSDDATAIERAYDLRGRRMTGRD